MGRDLDEVYFFLVNVHAGSFANANASACATRNSFTSSDLYNPPSLLFVSLPLATGHESLYEKTPGYAGGLAEFDSSVDK